MASIKKQTNNENLVQTKKWTIKNQMFSFHAIKKISNLNVSFFELRVKIAKECYT
jgi:hypothetical protein